ncbi:protein NEN1-like [Lycium ferocissimum]|uniref:protein NEN1-like n=1 Tax=Lycium ferocissimum TaxID=112874 RepID=UPI002814D83A|nr:protein NEN1-like [Lycium ferocissimum]
MMMGDERSEVAFFDIETTVPTRPGQGFAILEFGAILVCPRKLVEQEAYSTLVRPTDLTLISNLSVRCSGINPEVVTSAPTFAEIADKVYHILHGRIWAGHNILKFDCHRIREAFAGINRPAPEPKGIIDTLALLTQRFGRRAGDMKMASIATYFGLGRQTHRSLDDVRMNLEVLKYCGTVLLLESSLPDIFTENSWVSPNATTRSRSNWKASPEKTGFSADTPSSSVKMDSHVESTAQIVPFNMDEVEESLRSDVQEDESGSYSPESSTTATESFIGCTDFLEPNEISIPSISVSLTPFYRGSQKIQVFHDYGELQVCCRRMKVRFGVSKKYVNKVSLVVDASPGLCQILDAVDHLAQKLSVDSGSSSEWRPVVTRKPGFMNYPTVRLNLPTVIDGNISRWTTEIYQKESSTTQKLVFSRFDVEELESLITPGTFVDAYFSVDSYDVQQNAGIRLVANKLIVDST